MLSVSIMVVPSAAGHGTNDGAKKTQGGTRMDKAGRPKIWTDEKLGDAKY